MRGTCPMSPPCRCRWAGVEHSAAQCILAGSLACVRQRWPLLPPCGHLLHRLHQPAAGLTVPTDHICLLLRNQSLPLQLADFNFDGYTDVLLVSTDGIWAWAQVLRCAVLYHANASAFLSCSCAVQWDQQKQRQYHVCVAPLLLLTLVPQPLPVTPRRCAIRAPCPSQRWWRLSWSSWPPYLSRSSRALRAAATAASGARCGRQSGRTRAEPGSWATRCMRTLRKHLLV